MAFSRCFFKKQRVNSSSVFFSVTVLIYSSLLQTAVIHTSHVVCCSLLGPVQGIVKVFVIKLLEAKCDDTHCDPSIPEADASSKPSWST